MAIERISLSLRIFHDDLDPDQVTRDLDLSPTLSHRKGDPRVSKLGKVFAPYDCGLWLLSSEEKVDSVWLDDHLNELFQLIKGKEEAFERYKESGYRTDVFVLCALTDMLSVGPLVSWENSGRLSAFKLDLLFDVYW